MLGNDIQHEITEAHDKVPISVLTSVMTLKMRFEHHIFTFTKILIKKQGCLLRMGFDNFIFIESNPYYNVKYQIIEEFIV